MHISNIEVKNFRSLMDATLSPNQFNVLVGQNNHGKSNFLEAIEWFYNGSGDMKDILRKGAEPKSTAVEIEFSGVHSGLENMKNEKNRTTLEKKLGEADSVKILCRITAQGTVERVFLNPVTGEYESTGTGANNFLNDFLPKLQFVKTETSLRDVAKYGAKTEIGQMLAGVINEILVSEDDEYRQFVEKFNDLFIGENSKVSRELRKIGAKVESNLRKQFKECESVSFEVKSPKFEDLLKNFETSVDDGHKTTASEKGDGMQRALMLAIIQAYAEYRRENEKIKNFVFLIDEAELHLHPTAQRSLKKALAELAQNGDQVIITSHSSVLIADDEDSQKIFRVEKTENITDIFAVSDSEKASLVYDLLGGNPADLLLPRNFLLVEGTSDKAFLDPLINRLYPDKKAIQIIPVWGDIEKVERVFDYLGSVYAPLNRSLYQDKVVILIDKVAEDRATNLSDLLEKYPHLRSSGQLFQLPVGSLEEYYPTAPAGLAGGHRQPTAWKRAANHGLASLQKHTLAKHVGNNISSELFETDMSVVLNALNKCWDSAY
jgi:putative ATP-dependent endonuclease of OLD family